MKQRYTKILSLSLVAVLSLGLFGCGNNSGESKQPEENNHSGKTDSAWEEVLAEIPEELKGTKITVCNWNAISEYPGGATAIKEFTDMTGIEVEWQVEDFNTYISKLASMVASGETPDVVRMRSPLVTNYLSMQPVDVTGFDFSDGAWDSYVMDSYSVDGKCYGVSLANTHISSPIMLFYNKSLITKYDLEDPYTLWKNGQWTYDKFIQIMKDFKAETNADYVCSFFDYAEFSAMWGVEGPIHYDGKEYTSNLKDSTFISTTQTIADLINTDHLLARYKPEEFDQGKILFSTGSAIYARRQNAYFGNLKSAGSLQVVPMPTVEGEKEYVQFLEMEAYGIPKGAKNAAAVPYFLRFFLDRTNYDMDSFFASSQAEEVYDHCMQSKNKLWSTLYGKEYGFYDDDTTQDSFAMALLGATGAQVQTAIDSNASVVEQRIQRYNEQLETVRGQ